MVVISTLPPPDQGIKLEQPSTRVFMNDKELGKGIVYIAESRLSWVNSSTGRGFSLEYPHISVHAISRDPQTYPHHCLYVMVDTNVDFSRELEDGGGETGNTSDLEDEEEENELTEVRFVPDDHHALDAMYNAMNDCQALHPDPNDSISPDEDEDDNYDDEENDDDDEFVDANNDGGLTKNGNSWKMEVEGQFDDAEDLPP